MRANWILVGVLLSVVGCEFRIFGVEGDEDCNDSYSLMEYNKS